MTKNTKTLYNEFNKYCYMTTMSFSLDSELKKKIQMLSEETGIPSSWLIREAVKFYMENNGELLQKIKEQYGD